MSNVLFEAQDLCLAWKKRDKPTVENLSFKVKEGEFVAITGPSGSGKTTLLSAMEGFLKPQNGSLLFKGTDIYQMSAAQLAEYRNKSVGVVFQFFNLIAQMNAVENVEMPALLSGVPRNEARAKALGLLDEMGLLGKAEANVARLSGGQQQRVALARALVNEPQVILADEPTGNLDPAAANAVCDLLLKMRQNHGVALVVVTHDSEIAHMADRIIEMM